MSDSASKVNAASSLQTLLNEKAYGRYSSQGFSDNGHKSYRFDSMTISPECIIFNFSKTQILDERPGFDAQGRPVKIVKYRVVDKRSDIGVRFPQVAKIGWSKNPLKGQTNIFLMDSNGKKLFAFNVLGNSPPAKEIATWLAILCPNLEKTSEKT